MSKRQVRFTLGDGREVQAESLTPHSDDFEWSSYVSPEPTPPTLPIDEELPPTLPLDEEVGQPCERAISAPEGGYSKKVQDNRRTQSDPQDLISSL